ncbi:hypothetical protein [Treponema pallidum]|nr:hypothetical protein [Treponema pallidum]QUK74419.1 hypothetical protein KD993_00675 [Treponema pallidum]QUL24447.1 hypothetical protein KEA53_00675 [Treponema pallidum]WGK70657.1 hypothetical protein TPE6RU_0133 [Treponema pallidum subsp. pertenue]WGK71634.1 hypothetical protein TPE7SN_0133 [Treponema pallidum subsp. pertenue]WGK72605.1 hypothetical protein TPE18NC_0133 [Treponema pallidum subsp. pertenue]
MARSRCVHRVVHQAACIGVIGLSTSALTTCDFTGIFVAIQSEVPIKTPSIPGAIYGLVKAGSKLYATNGQLWKKNVAEEGKDWERESCFDSVIGDSRITSLAADNGENGVLVACILGKGAYKWSQGSADQTSGNPSALSGTEKALSVVGTGTSCVYLNHTDDKVGETSSSESGGMTASGETNEFCLHAGNGFLVTTKKVCVGSDGSPVAKSDGEEPVPPILAATDDGSGHVYILTKDKVYCKKVNQSEGKIQDCPQSAAAAPAPTGAHSVAHKVADAHSIAFFKNGSDEFLLIGGRQGYGEIKLERGSGSNGNGAQCVHLKEENVHDQTGWHEKGSTPKDGAEQYRSTIGRWAVSGIYVIKKGTSGGRKKRSTSTDCERPDLYVAVGDASDTYTGLWKFDTTTCSWNRE